MNTIQMFIQTIWASLLALGLIKIVLFVIIDGLLFRVNPLIGTLGFVLFIAYLAHWI